MPLVEEQVRERTAREPEHRRANRFGLLGGAAGVSAVLGGAGVALAIIALAGALPAIFGPIAVMSIGLSLLLLGLASGSGYSRAGALISGGSAELAAGLSGLVLGLISLTGISLVFLLVVATLVLGGGLLLGALATSSMGFLSRERTDWSQQTTSESKTWPAIAAFQAVVGASVITLGIIALHVIPFILSMVAMLGLGGYLLLSGTVFGGRFASKLERH